MLQTTRLARLAAAAVTVGSVLVAGTSAASATTSPARPVVVVHATSAGGVSVPASTHPGLVELHDTGKQSIFLVRPLHGASKAALVRDLNAKTPAGFLADFTVADILPGVATTYLRLGRGDYYLADTEAEFRAATIATLHVAGATVNATAPTSVPVTVTSQDKLASPAKIGVDSVLSYTNSSRYLQELFLVRVTKHVSAKTLNAFLAKPSFDKLDTVTTEFPALVAMLSPQGRAASSQQSTSGRYLLFTAPLTVHSTQPTLAAGRIAVLAVH